MEGYFRLYTGSPLTVFAVISAEKPSINHAIEGFSLGGLVSSGG